LARASATAAWAALGLFVERLGAGFRAIAGSPRQVKGLRGLDTLLVQLGLALKGEPGVFEIGLALGHLRGRRGQVGLGLLDLAVGLRHLEAQIGLRPCHLGRGLPGAVFKKKPRQPSIPQAGSRRRSWSGVTVSPWRTSSFCRRPWISELTITSSVVTMPVSKQPARPPRGHDIDGDHRQHNNGNQPAKACVFMRSSSEPAAGSRRVKGNDGATFGGAQSD